MMVKVGLGTWPGELKLFRDLLPKNVDHHMEVTPK